MGKKRGQVLVQTVVTAMIVAILAAALMRLVLQRYTIGIEVTNHTINERCLQMAVGQFYSYWDTAPSTGGGPVPVCSSEAGVFACGGTPGSCSCTCTFASAALAGLSVQVGGPTPNPPCTFTATIASMQSPPSGCVQ